MILLLIYAVLLLVAVLVAELASRSVLSTSVLFLLGGFLAGPGGLGWIALSPDRPGLDLFVEITLFAVLFGDGMRLPPREVGPAWRLAGRALLLGMPLVFAVTTWLAHAVAGLDWTPALLVGAVLAPTDPVFAAALIGREDVPVRLRNLLNVESGVNDGLALPAVLLLLAGAGDALRGAAPLPLFGEVVSELLKLGALLLLGVLVAPKSWSDLGPAAWIFAGLVLVIARPLPLLAVFLGSPLDRRERIAAAWFGPRGFASVAYALLVQRSGIAGSRHIYHLLALVIAVSIVAHSSTDVLVARWFHEQEEQPAEGRPA